MSKAANDNRSRRIMYLKEGMGSGLKILCSLFSHRVKERHLPAPICSHDIRKQGEAGTKTAHQQKSWNCLLSNARPARSECYRSWPSCTQNPKSSVQSEPSANGQGRICS